MITIRKPRQALCALTVALLGSAIGLPKAAAQQPTAAFHVVFNFEEYGGGPASFIESEPGIFYGSMKRLLPRLSALLYFFTS